MQILVSSISSSFWQLPVTQSALSLQISSSANLQVKESILKLLLSLNPSKIFLSLEQMYKGFFSSVIQTLFSHVPEKHCSFFSHLRVKQFLREASSLLQDSKISVGSWISSSFWIVFTCS